MPHATRHADQTNEVAKRYSTNLDWQEDAKIKTCKCSVCGLRVKNYSRQCMQCMKRICSECAEDNGSSSTQHKAIAADHLHKGCWCGFIGKINPAMEALIPRPPLPNQPQKPSHVSKKRKRTSPISEEDSTVDSPLEQQIRTAPRTNHRPSRNIKRHSHAEWPHVSEPEAEYTPPKKKVTLSLKQKYPVGDSARRSTVVVGAGVIGLFIALELAEKAHTSKTAHDITVVDVNNGPCQLASGHCAGLINTKLPNEQWQPLLDVSTPLWEELLNDPGFSKSTGFSPKHFVMAVVPDKADAVGPPISWVRKDSNLSCIQDQNVKGRIDPLKLAEWLKAHCTHFGVKFRFNMRPTGIERERTGKITGVRVLQANATKGRTELIDCSNLVIAAGPFSKALLSDLFPLRQLALENNPQIHQWIQIQHASISKRSQVTAALDLPDGVFSGPALISARKGLIELSRQYSVIPEYSLTHEDATRARIGSSTALRFLATETLSLPGVHLGDKKHILSQGVSIVSTGNEKNPVIGRIPDWLSESSKSTGEASRGLWLAYGFGMAGTTLAPGVGRLLGQMILGEEPEVDMFDFAVTELEVPDAIDLEQPTKRASKGKARA